ncbi:family 2 glycosyl transferase [filamentous cyanobacterium CCP5]|nr:family 2 glycosyl transferase [filamentous cyanobacterium CCP5]
MLKLASIANTSMSTQLKSLPLIGWLRQGLWPVWNLQKRLRLSHSIKIATSDEPQRELSVVIGSYNRNVLLQKTIQSVRENCQNFDYEIIVIDGGSADGALSWLIEQKDIVTIVQHNRGEFQGNPIKRRSWGYFMNLGFKVAQGKYVLMLSDDCLLLPQAVERGVARFTELTTSQRKIGAVAFYFRNWPEEKEYYVQKTIGDKLIVNHGLYLRSALAAVGWADEQRYIFYKADGDLCLKMWQVGYEVVDAPGAYVEHYYDAEEAVRQTNNAVFDHDRKAYADRWRDVFYNPYKPNPSGRIFVDHSDPTQTAERTWLTS